MSDLFVGSSIHKFELNHSNSIMEGLDSDNSTK